jgi:TolB-like protein
MKASQLFSELKRRRVIRVATAYAIVGFAVAEGLDLFLPRLGVPEWTVTALIVALLAGFPIALVMAWALEIGSGGIRVTEPLGDGDGGTSPWPGRAGFIAVFALGALLSLGGWWMMSWIRGSGMETAATVRSLAILPFSALSDESGDHWMAQGLHDQLITEMAQLSGLDRVISRTSVLRYAENPPGIIEIARVLNVDAIIEGSILPSEDRIRINIQLIAGETDGHLWARDYERPREEALDLVKSVAQDIATELSLELTATDEARFEVERSVNPAAQEAYFRGRAFLDQRTGEGISRAAEQFQRAIDLDPEYGQAYAGMASYHALGQAGGDVTRVEEYAQRALDLDPGLAEAYAAMGFTHIFRDQAWDEAEEHFRTAVRLQPGFSTGWQWGADLLAGRGKGIEAVEWIRRARELDPFSGIIAWNELRILYLTGHFEECLSANDRYAVDFADYPRSGNREFCLLGAGRYAEVVELLEAPDSIREAVTEGRIGDFWGWADQYPEWMGMWIFDAQLDRTDEFFQKFDNVWEARGGLGLNLTYYVADPLMDPLRQDPRWGEIFLPRVGLARWPG